MLEKEKRGSSIMLLPLFSLPGDNSLDKARLHYFVYSLFLLGNEIKKNQSGTSKDQHRAKVGRPLFHPQAVENAAGEQPQT